ncbi:MAG: hypothetical protein OHK006_10200 [Thermodesulfovibrionales bacterium]
MPVTFVDIEQRRSWRIGLFFALLIALYFLVTFSLVAGWYLFLPSGGAPLLFRFGIAETLAVAVFAVAVAGIHFYFASRDAVSTVITALGAVPPDPDDAVHRRLVNVMEEINVASGRTPRIRVLVVPSLSMNALAAADWRGESVIVITEGLLSRLNRAQTEAVLAHEAYHILSGDCLEATVASSLFGMYAALTEKMHALAEDERGKGAGFFPAMTLFWVLLKLSQLLNLFISREREYRADAAALRMTRNPIAMAEVLYLLGRNWNGTGIISTGFEMLCIVHPLKNALDEAEGWFADLFSTHPPVEKRIEVLLRLAKIGIAEFSARQEFKDRDTPKDQAPVYYARARDQAWEGPFTLAQMSGLPWLMPDTWIAGPDRKAVGRASEDEHLGGILMMRSAAGEQPTDWTCPVCRMPLVKTLYEKTAVFSCRSCGGTLVDSERLPRIIVRREVECSARVEALARAVVEDNYRASLVRKMRKREPEGKRALKCGRCGRQMFRTFYSTAYLLEIDRCGPCGVVWFDRDELEMLQCLIERKITPRISPGADAG